MGEKQGYGLQSFFWGGGGGAGGGGRNIADGRGGMNPRLIQIVVITTSHKIFWPFL